ncbi:MAG: hypothetical protein ACE5HQ_07045 [Gemmatimonadota bacterium]
MATGSAEEYRQLVERTRAVLEHFRERANQVRGDLASARADRKVQIKAMVARLERRYEQGLARLAELSGGESGDLDEMVRFHQQVVTELADMQRTIERRAL